MNEIFFELPIGIVEKAQETSSSTGTHDYVYVCMCH